jgi:hypothetical protein
MQHHDGQHVARIRPARPRRLRYSWPLGPVVLAAALAACGPESEITEPTQPADATAAPDSATASATNAAYYVTPAGRSSGDGSMSRPWDLKSVLAGGHRLAAGTTVWVRAGTYRTGEVNASVSGVVLRAYPGERAAIDGNLYIAGANTTYWGLEVYQSSPTSTSKMGLNVRAPGTRLINCVIHDAGMSGVGFWMEAPNSEATGNIVYNNGTHGNLDHGFYVMNASGTKLLRDNLVFDNSGYGFHMYGEDNQYIRNVTLDGNVAWNSGAIASGRPDFFAGSSEVMSGIVVRNNFSYRSDLGETADLGWDYGPTHQDLTYTNNYLVGSVHITRWSTINQSNNTVLTSRPSSGTKVVVRPNPYESGRANIVVYNWSRQGSVSADVSGVLRAGDHYEVRNAQNFATGTPVLSGTYQGGSLSLPMSGTRPAVPLGRSTATAPTTGPEFDVFVLITVP